MKLFYWPVGSILIFLLSLLSETRALAQTAHSAGTHNEAAPDSAPGPRERPPAPTPSASAKLPSDTYFIDSKSDSRSNERSDERAFEATEREFQDATPLNAALRKKLSGDMKITADPCWKAVTQTEKGETTYEKLPEGVLLYFGKNKEKNRLAASYVDLQKRVRANRKGTATQQSEMDEEEIRNLTEGLREPAFLRETGPQFSFKGQKSFSAGPLGYRQETEIEIRGTPGNEIVRIERKRASHGGTPSDPTKQTRREVIYCR